MRQNLSSKILIIRVFGSTENVFLSTASVTCRTCSCGTITELKAYMFASLCHFIQLTLDSTGGWSLKLGGFSLAAVATEPLSLICGNQYYRAPEMIVETGSVRTLGKSNSIALTVLNFPP